MRKRRPLPALAEGVLELVAARFRVLGEPSRLRLLRALEEGAASVGDLVGRTGLTQANASRHLQALHDAGILGRRRDGLQVIYRITDPEIFALCDLVCGALEKRTARQTRLFSGGRRAH